MGNSNSNMTEQDLISLGFEKNIRNEEEEWTRMFDSDVRVAMALLTYIRENK